MNGADSTSKNGSEWKSPRIPQLCDALSGPVVSRSVLRDHDLYLVRVGAFLTTGIDCCGHVIVSVG
jgi:hypothetical protein